MNLFRLAALCLLLVSNSALAVIETYEFDTPELHDRYRALSQELRCPKCQNQNIADSNAPISQDLRQQLYLQLQSGATDAEIKAYMVDRYGEFVLYNPRFSAATAGLWIAPAALLLAAIGVVYLSFRRKSGDAGSERPAFSADDQSRLDSLLQGEGNK